MVASWEIVEEETLAAFRIGAIRRVRARSPRTGVPHDFYELRFPEWVNVVALDAERRVLLIRQWRLGTRSVTLEIPGGLVEPGEEPAEAARRELREETGYESPRWSRIGVVHPNPAIQGNRCWIFLAEEAVRAGPPRFDAAEDIETIPTPLREIPGLMRRGEITHTLVLSAFAWLWFPGLEAAAAADTNREERGNAGA